MVHILENLGNYGLSARIEAAMTSAVSVASSDKAPAKLMNALEYATFPGGVQGLGSEVGPGGPGPGRLGHSRGPPH